MRTRQCEVFSFFQAQVEIIDVGTCQVDEVSWIECVFGLRIGTPAPPPPRELKNMQTCKPAQEIPLQARFAQSYLFFVFLN